MGQCVQLRTKNYGALDQTARVCFGVLCANRTREVKRDFADRRIRSSEGRVVDTHPCCLKRVVLRTQGKEKGRRPKKNLERERKRKRPEKRQNPRERVKKTRNAGGVEHEHMN
ncbi:hypothetical protein TNCV_185881 [Trichonephila clavipes]|nr:hypothetical protein TNCV_185881 [Trichonephila clavipes]